MDPELQQIDHLLDDDTLFQSVKNDLSKRHPQTLRRGRRSTPVEVIVRMLLLKHLCDWSYEVTEHFVKDSLSLRQFCRVYLEKVPDDTVLIRWAQLISEPTLRALHEHLVREAVRRKLTRGRKLRVDTTAVETNIHYPTDSSLLQESVRVLSGMTKKVHDLAEAAGVHVRNFSRSAKRRALNILKFTKGRNDDANKAVKRAYQELCEITQRAVHQAKHLEKALKDSTSRKAKRFVERCASVIPTVEKIISQTRKRIVRNVKSLLPRELSVSTNRRPRFCAEVNAPSLRSLGIWSNFKKSTVASSVISKCCSHQAVTAISSSLQSRNTSNNSVIRQLILQLIVVFLPSTIKRGSNTFT